MARVSKIGFVSFETPNLGRSVDYYEDVLGLSVVDRAASQVLVGSTMDHHSIVLRVGVNALCDRIGFQVGPNNGLNEMGSGPAWHRPQHLDLSPQRG